VRVTERTLAQAEAHGNLFGIHCASRRKPMPNLSLRRLILVPALVTLAVTLVRLTGELLLWSGGPG